jgi:hypothetical protein
MDNGQAVGLILRGPATPEISGPPPVASNNPAINAPKPKLLDQVRLAIRARHDSPRTIDFTFNQILVRDRNGPTDRVTRLPQAVKKALAEHLQPVRQWHLQDHREGTGRVQLPDGLAREYPHADREWGWQWAFPAPTRSFDSGADIRRRHHWREREVQRASLAIDGESGS